jgi:two-component system, chemotaxis family, protein-glutamate methylesterase/glutaminase
MLKRRKKYEAIVVGTSAGGFHALSILLENIPPDYFIPIMVVQHRAKDSRELFEEALQRKCRTTIKQADEKEKVQAGRVYVAPPDYHLLVEMDRTFSLSSDSPVQFSRPSIDVLFESAALVFKDQLIGVILTGANNDGAAGITAIRRMGGLTIAQDPAEAEYSFMTQASIDTGNVTYIWPLARIRDFLKQLPASGERDVV